MWIVRIALNRPYTFIVAALVIVLITPIVLQRTPDRRLSEHRHSGRERLLGFTPASPHSRWKTASSPPYERFLTTVVGQHRAHRVANGRRAARSSRSSSSPGADIRLAVSPADVRLAIPFCAALPPGISAPLIITYSASDVPILQLGMKGQGLSEQELFDYGANLVRNQMATVPGDGDSLALRRQAAPGLGQRGYPRAAGQGSLAGGRHQRHRRAESGAAFRHGQAGFDRVQRRDERVARHHRRAQQYSRSRPSNGATIYVHDVAYVSDGFSPQINIVRMDGQRGVLVTVYKTGNASTLDVVSHIYAKLPQIASLAAAATGDHAALRPIDFRARRHPGRDSRGRDRRLPHRR